jgi:SAM-dependent methyltransferase
MRAVPDFDGRAYQARFNELAATGLDVHGEAAFVLSFNPASVLDAGCGTGRVAIELARRGVEVVGVDVDASMLAEAKRLAPELTWIEADLATLGLGRQFEIVVLAGNVPLFCPAPSRPQLVASCAMHVESGGNLIAGFQLGRGYTLSD